MTKRISRSGPLLPPPTRPAPPMPPIRPAAVAPVTTPETIAEWLAKQRPRSKRRPYQSTVYNRALDDAAAAIRDRAISHEIFVCNAVDAVLDLKKAEKEKP